MKKLILAGILIFGLICFKGAAYASVGQANYNYGGYYIPVQTLVIFRHQTELTVLKRSSIPLVSSRMTSIFLKLRQLADTVQKQVKHKYVSGIKNINIYGFKVNSYILGSNMKGRLNLIPKYEIISITGYTDRFGSKNYNDILAVKRAESAEKYLNIHVKIAGYGQCCYVSAISRFNRRIVVKIK